MITSFFHCYFFIIFLCIVHGVYCVSKEDDKIEFLPGASFTQTFMQYSGYLDGETANIQLHYWLVEAIDNSENLPLVLWLNGGPGCSSMDGLFTENGPYNVMKDGSLEVNPYSWNKYANMLYLESPAGVGFSYAVDGNTTVNDDIASLHNFHALLNFMKRFPEYKRRNFFITGESFAGVYIPTLALRIIESNLFNFKGIAVGNGLTSYKLNDNSAIYFTNYHGLIGEEIWESLMKDCCDSKLKTRCMFTDNKSKTCQSLVNYIADKALSGLNMYNIYAPCAGGANVSSEYLLSEHSNASPIYIHGDLGNHFRTNIHTIKRRLFANKMRDERSRLVIPCVDDSGIVKYFNLPVVRTAIHASEKIDNWAVCSDEINKKYQRVYTDLTEQYLDVLKNKIAILIYNGDIDLACNYLGDEWFVDNLNLTCVDANHDWLYEDADGTMQIGGYSKTFTMNGTSLKYTTIRGSGHMVPTDRPIPALYMFKNFIEIASLSQ